MENSGLPHTGPYIEAPTSLPESSPVAGMLMNGIGVGVIFVEAGGRLAFINRKAEAILQATAGSVLGKMVDMLPLRTPIYKVLSEDCREAPVEVSINGAVIVVESSAMYAPGGEMLGEMFELRDVTEEKKEKRRREEIVAMMTHDLKSPLTVLMGYVQALKGEMPQKVDASLQPCLREMDRSAMKLLAMIEDVLDAYRLEVGLLQINRAVCDLRTLLDGCCRDGLHEAATRGSHLSYSIADDIPPLMADGKQLSRVFANLIGNALKFTPRRGTVTVTASARNGEILVSVEDTGIGIPKEDLPRIFNKYFRSSSATGFKGTGLGLTISKAIVEAHGGTIEVESVEGEGSRFTVIIPQGQKK